jgi:hypothetical protein
MPLSLVERSVMVASVIFLSTVLGPPFAYTPAAAPLPAHQHSEPWALLPHANRQGSATAAGRAGAGCKKQLFCRRMHAGQR